MHATQANHHLTTSLEPMRKPDHKARKHSKPKAESHIRHTDRRADLLAQLECAT